MTWDRSALANALDHLAWQLHAEGTPATWFALTKPAHVLLNSDKRRRQWFGPEAAPMRPHPTHLTYRKNIDSVWVWKKVRGRLRKEHRWLLPPDLHDSNSSVESDNRQRYAALRVAGMSSEDAADAALLLG